MGYANVINGETSLEKHTGQRLKLKSINQNLCQNGD